MHRYLLVVCLMFLAGCATQDTSTPVPQTADGPTTAAALTARYRNTASNCGSDTKPAFLCSGVILRVTETSSLFDPWEPSDTSLARGGVSFSYLRKDNNFDRLWKFTNGYILYPILDMPTDKLKIPVLCMFPVDGWTNGRLDRNSCGTYPGYSSSAPCHLHNPIIETGAQWNAAFGNATHEGYRICGFDVRDELNQYAGPNFYAGMQARWQNSNHFQIHNELVLKVWQRGQARVLPIQAFFYTDANGLANAKIDRQKFLSQTGITLPVIKMTLPAIPTGDATFQYVPGDQR